MGFQDLSHIHTAWNAERIQNDIDRRAVLKIWHILNWHDVANHTFVTVTARHLIAWLDLALHCDEDLNHLHDARRQLVAALQLVDFIDEALFQTLLCVVILTADSLYAGHRLL